MKPPAMESAVQTTPPITSAATIPPGPFRPTATITTDARISVISVMPDTGLVPTMAMALAATVVKRNEMPATSRIATTVCALVVALHHIEVEEQRNQYQRHDRTDSDNLHGKVALRTLHVGFRISLAAHLFGSQPYGALMMLHDLMIPMIPAIAMPPIPMLLA